MRGILSKYSILLAAASVMTGVSSALAVYPFDTMTFDTAATVSTNATYNEPPLIARFDFGDGNPSSANSVGWTNAADHDGDGGGSIALAATYTGTESGNDEKAGFTLDIAPSAVAVSNLSFYIMIDPSSPSNSNPNDVYGSGMQDASSGFMQVAVRDQNYNFLNTGNVTVNGNNIGSNGWNLGDPTFSGTSDKGTWEFVSIPLTATDDSLRAITIQDFVDNSSTGRVLNGTVTLYVDDIQLTPLPEPASLAILGLVLPGIFVRRRA